MRLWLAIRAFFRVLFDGDIAARIRGLLEGEPQPPPAPETPQVEPPKPAKAPAPIRNDAITLLETLQREARFVDIVQEPMNDYSDAEVGAAARDVFRDCAGVIDRLFALQPVVEQMEGDMMEVPAGYDVGRYRLTGSVAGEAPFAGQLVHPGWQASRCELPQWSGSPQSSMIVAPVEVEVVSSNVQQGERVARTK